MTHHKEHDHTHSNSQGHTHSNSQGHTHSNSQGHTHSSSHGHTHSSSHEHTHNHSHAHAGKESELELDEKLRLLFKHWIDHNNSHRDTYLSWAKKAEDADFLGVAHHLKEAEEASGKITEHLTKALKAMEK